MHSGCNLTQRCAAKAHIRLIYRFSLFTVISSIISCPMKNSIPSLSVCHTRNVKQAKLHLCQKVNETSLTASIHVCPFDERDTESVSQTAFIRPRGPNFHEYIYVMYLISADKRKNDTKQKLMTRI